MLGAALLGLDLLDPPPSAAKRVAEQLTDEALTQHGAAVPERSR